MTPHNTVQPQDTSAARGRSPTGPPTDPADAGTERAWLIDLFGELIEPIGRSLPLSSEVVLHDLALLPDSIVAVHGDVTGRRVGDPATDLLLQRAVTGELDTVVGCHTDLPDGRSMRSTTMIIRDRAGQPVAALCINSDLSMWQSLARVASAMTSPPGGGAADAAPFPPVEQGQGGGGQPGEVFARDVDELAAHLIHQAIRHQGVPVDLMKKEHKLEVVRDLQGRGLFMLRDAVEMIASSLQVTRFTIYNYLNELDDAGSTGRRAAGRTTKGKG
jgi:predicted transcriptional regulator YheO